MRITQVDAFTDRPFAGNPAAVCVLAAPASDHWMQAVAREMNLSETAFLHHDGGTEGAYRLRWFTPAVEVDLCGHATLAASHVLWEEGHLPRGEPAVFSTRSGRLACRHHPDGWITMNFPARPVEPVTAPDGLLESLALDARPLWVGSNGMDLLVELSDEHAVRSLRPDFHRLAAVDARGLIVTARPADVRTCDFVSRFFAPRVGVAEDPVTGSAHCALGPFWAPRLGRDRLVGHQISERGGVVRVGVVGDRVELGGQAVTVLRGDLLSEPGPR
jgi:PhzF family phenazine biosynthesis protein